MENCPKIETLFQWLHGSLQPDSANGISTHVRDCDACQKRLSDLTDENSLKPAAQGTLDGSLDFTDEPQFKKLRLNLSEKLVKLRPKPAVGQHAELEQSVGAPETARADLESTLGENGTNATIPPKTIGSELKNAFAEQGYEIEGLIGSGGFARVYQAWEKRLERSVAIKLLDEHRINSRNRHRFLREAKTASSIDSPNVVKVLTCGELQERPYIVLELIAGVTIGQWLGQQNQNPIQSDTISDAVKLLVQACAGVQSVHDAGLVHRDIKPSNLFVDSENQTAKLGDFGLARILNDDTLTLTRAAELVGTPAFMSPEQTLPNGDVTTASDVYSLGATFYQILTGRPPFQGSSVAILKQINEAQPIPPTQLNESVSQDYETICLKALEKDPARRYASPQHLADDLSRALNGEPIVARPLSRLQRAARWIGSNKSLTTALGLLFVSMLVGTIASSVMWYRASVAEKQAVDDRAAILESMNHLVATVFEDLGNNAATIKARESVLQAAIDGLDSITKVGGDAQADYTRMIAYRRLGTMMNFKKDETAAKDYFSQAVELARELRAQTPTNQTALDLAASLNDFSDHHELFQTESEDREKQITESKQLIDEVLASDSNNAGALYLSLRNDAVRFKVMFFRANSGAQAVLNESQAALEKVERLLKHPQKNHYPEEIAREIQFQIARSHIVCKDYDKAAFHLKQSRTHLEKVMAREPNNQKMLEHQVALTAVDALIASEQGNPDLALQLGNEAVEAWQKLVADDPNNASRRQQLANSYTIVTKSLTDLELYEEAIETQDKSFGIYKELLDQTPNDNLIRVSLAIDLMRYRAPLELLQHQWQEAKETYQRFIHFIQGPEFGEPLTAPGLDVELNQAAMLIEVMDLLEGAEDAVRNTNNECVALLYVARRDADTSGLDRLTDESLEVMSHINPEIEASTLSELFDHIRTLEGLTDTLRTYADQIEVFCVDRKARTVARGLDSVEK